MSDDPNGFPLTILDHQFLAEWGPCTLFRTELFVPETVVKLYTGTELSELMMPRPADTTYKGQFRVCALASATRKLLPQ